MYLTPHFDLDEFKKSKSFRSIARRMEIPSRAQNSLYLLCLFILEPLRAEFGPLIITSGYRNAELNQAVGGSSTSQHCSGEAADIYLPKASSMENVYNFILDELEWEGEVIYYLKRGHIHVGLPNIMVEADQYKTLK